MGWAAPRRRQDRRPGQRLAQAGAPHQGGADDHECAPGPGCPDHRPGDQARAGVADHSPPPRVVQRLGVIHISEPTRLGMISYAVFCLKKKKKYTNLSKKKTHTKTKTIYETTHIAC